jgi:hypothetical protein
MVKWSDLYTFAPEAEEIVPKTVEEFDERQPPD